MQVTKSKGLNTLLEKIESINLAEADSKTLSAFMDATKVLDGFTKQVKGEMLQRLEDGQEIEGYAVGNRTTEKVTSEKDAADYMEKKGFDTDEIYDTKLKPAKELKNMLSIKDRGEFPSEKTTSVFVRRKK